VQAEESLLLCFTKNGPTFDRFFLMSSWRISVKRCFPSNDAPNVDLSEIYPEQVLSLKSGEHSPSGKDPKTP